jgi:nanoRNase/pAp phosphatase (c-di-AMP/oligoRNAs hydrolase)
LLAFLAKNKKTLAPLLILTHDYPDPDALAGAFTLHYLCEARYGIPSRIAYGGVIGRMENREMVRMLKIPVHRLKSDLKRYQRVALIDTQPEFENNPFPKTRRAALVIDQHSSLSQPSADLAIVDTACGATSVILAQALLASGLDLSPRVATALVYGILSDTLNLYRARRADVIETYLKILPHCDLKILARIQNPPRSRKFFATLAQGIRKTKRAGKLVISHLGWVENPDLVSQVADFLLNYERIHAVFCTGRYRGELRASLRMAGAAPDAGEVLRDVFVNRGGAGGRESIAGGSFRVGKEATEILWKKTERFLEGRLMKRFGISERSPFSYPFRRV